VVDVDPSQDGQALPSSIEASQVMATVYTVDFSSSNPQDSSEDPSHPTDGDTTTPSTQPPILRRDLSIVYDHINTICAIIQRIFRQNKL